MRGMQHMLEGHSDNTVGLSTDRANSRQALFSVRTAPMTAWHLSGIGGTLTICITPHEKTRALSAYKVMGRSLKSLLYCKSTITVT